MTDGYRPGDEPAVLAGRPEPRGRVLLVVPARARRTVSGEIRRSVGGAELRFGSLHEALSATWTCDAVEARCGAPHTPHDGCGFYAENGEPWYYNTSFCPRFAEQLRTRIHREGIAHIVCSSLNVYRYVPALSGTEASIAFDLHNIEGKLYREMRSSMNAGDEYDQVLSDANAARIEVAEQSAIDAADVLWVCSQEDLVALPEIYNSAASKPVVHVPDTVAVGSPPDDTDLTRAVFTARLDYFPNVLAAEFILSTVAPRMPDFPFVVAGAQPHVRLRGNHVPNATLVADPPEIGVFFPGSVMVVPLTHGGGSRFKIIEAFASGCPVVSTRKGAEGLGAAADEHYVAAESADEFVAAIDRLRHDSGLRRATRAAAWDLVNTQHSTARLGELLSTWGWPGVTAEPPLAARPRR